MGLKITEKTKNNLKSIYDGAVDAYFLKMKKRGEKFTIGSFLKWWALSIKVTWGLFFFSILAESQRKDDGFWENLDFAIAKIKQSPERFLISLLPGVNLITSSGNLLYQVIVSGVTLSVRKISGWSTKPIPKGESGIFTNPDFPLDNKGNDPDGIR